MPRLRSRQGALAAMLLAVSSVLGGIRARAEDPPEEDLRQWAEATVAERAERGEPLAAFPADAEWLNVSRPLTLEGDLRGRVLLLDFWCYCCINCMHVLPDLEYLEEKYADRPFTVIGVHSAKFLNEKQTENIRDAVLRHGIRHPVINDGDFRVWNSVGARSWPTFALVSPDGRYLGRLSGEGRRAELDALVAAALAHYGGKGLLDAKPLPLRPERPTRMSGALSFPGKLRVDGPSQRLYVSDTNHHRVLELGLDGSFVRAFGDGEPGLVDGGAASAHFRRPQGLALRDGVLYVADTENHVVRRIDLGSAVVSTLAGTGRQGRHLDAAEDAVPRPARELALSSPWDVHVLGSDLVVANAGTHQLVVLDVAADTARLLAGDGYERRQDAARPLEASFAQPSALASDGGALYVADSESSSVVVVDAQGGVRTLAGASDDPRDLFHFGDEDGAGHGRRFQHPLGLVHHAGLLWVGDSYNHRIKSIDPATGAVRTRWGTGAPGFGDDPPAFSEPGGIDAFAGVLYVADTNNHAIRTIEIETGTVRTLALEGVPIPQVAAREAARPAEWPSLPGTEDVVLPPASVGADAPLTLTVRLALPEDWHLTEGAPSAVRVEGTGDPQEATLDGPELGLALPALEAGAEAGLVVRILAYVCRDGGSCRIRSANLHLTLRAEAGGPTAVLVEDRFVP